MIDFKAILRSIMDTYQAGTQGSEVLSGIIEKIDQGSATYADIYRAALEHGRILSGSLRGHLPEALEEGAENLSPEIAMAIIKPPMVSSAKDIGRLASRVQTELNRKSDIGIGFIEPEPNANQINGIITGLCRAESFEDGEGVFLDRVQNYLEGYVDDCVHDNAKFQYEAGLNPTIERHAMPGCCDWCSALAGVYDYAKVSNSGNDVFRRHRNCHCQVIFNPGNGSKNRQNAHNKRWTEEGKADRIKFAEGSAEEAKGVPGDGLDSTIWEKVNPNRMQRLKNGFSAYPEGDILNTYLQNVQPEKGFFDVAMHGSADAVGFGTKTANMKARDLAKIIRRDEQYDGGPVRLLCCNTGEIVNGEYCFAEELANALGVIVRAPEDVVFFYQNGQFEIGSDELSGFHDYIPNERRRIR